MKCFALVMALAVVPFSVSVAHASQITGQDVSYALSLSKLRTHAITGATGSLHFQVVDGCTGWATAQRMTLIIRSADGSLEKTENDYTTWESKDGTHFTFNVTETDDDGPVKVIDSGTATRSSADGAGVIKYTEPTAKEVAFPAGTLFPLQHTQALLEAGQAGHKFISPLLFDGTSDDGAEATFVTILGHHPAQATPWPALNGYGSSDVSIAFFPHKNQDTTPDFRTSMRYFNNAVATDLELDFGDFVMSGKVTSLQIPKSACPAPRG